MRSQTAHTPIKWMETVNLNMNYETFHRILTMRTTRWKCDSCHCTFVHIAVQFTYLAETISISILMNCISIKLAYVIKLASPSVPYGCVCEWAKVLCCWAFFACMWVGYSVIYLSHIRMRPKSAISTKTAGGSGGELCAKMRIEAPRIQFDADYHLIFACECLVSLIKHKHKQVMEERFESHSFGSFIRKQCSAELIIALVIGLCRRVISRRISEMQITFTHIFDSGHFSN